MWPCMQQDISAELDDAVFGQMDALVGILAQNGIAQLLVDTAADLKRYHADEQVLLHKLQVYSLEHMDDASDAYKAIGRIAPYLGGDEHAALRFIRTSDFYQGLALYMSSVRDAATNPSTDMDARRELKTSREIMMCLLCDEGGLGKHQAEQLLSRCERHLRDTIAKVQGNVITR